MKKRLLQSAIRAGLFVTIAALSLGATYAQKNGQAVIPDGHIYTITTAAELKWVADKVNIDHYVFEKDTIVLGNDIDLSGIEWVPIGTHAYPFRGTFDGKGHVIKNLVMYRELTGNAVYYGLFGYVSGRAGAPAILRNLGLIDFYFELSATQITQGHFGLLAGYVQYGEIDNCYVDNGYMNALPGNEQSYTGGIVGFANCTLRNCFVENSTVISLILTPENSRYQRISTIGGIAGIAYADITDCYTSQTLIRSNVAHTGGIVGQTNHHVRNCFTSGTISMDKTLYPSSLVGTYYGARVGGIAGNANATGNDIKNCYSTALIHCQVGTPDYYESNQRLPIYLQIGGITGYSGHSIKNCYYTGRIHIADPSDKNNRYEVGGLVGGGIPGPNTGVVKIYNSIFAGEFFGTEIDQVTCGAILGVYSNDLSDSDKQISHNYYLDTGHPAIGATAMLTPSHAVNHPIEASRLLETDFYWDENNWDYYNTLADDVFWTLKNYSYADGRMPLLRHLVKTYTSPKWDGLSMQIVPANADYTVMKVDNAAQLAWIAGETNNQVSFAGKTIELTTDIDLDNHYWPGIGNTAEYPGTQIYFTGTFDGGNHWIRNYKTHDFLSRGWKNNAFDRHLGLFGYIRGASTLRNIRLDNCEIILSNHYTSPYQNQSRRINAGALAAQTADSLVNITDCLASRVKITSEPAATTGTYFIGGLIGRLEYGGHVDRCAVEVDASVYVKDDNYETAFGGLIGRVYAINTHRLSISHSAAIAKLSGNMRYTGGLIGLYNAYSNYIDLGITDCYVGPGSVVNESIQGKTGGFIGYLSTITPTDLTRCFSLASVEGLYYTGGFVGQANGAQFDITQCFARGNVKVGAYAGTSNTPYAAGGFIGQSSVVIRDCYATGNVESFDQTKRTGHLGGFVGNSGSRTAYFNCYATGSISASEASGSTLHLGGFAGGNIVNTWNSFAAGWVSEEAAGTVNFNGLFGSPNNNPIYINEVYAYTPYLDKKFGTYTDPLNFRTPAFFTEGTAWRELTVEIAATNASYTTDGWSPDRWICEDALFPMLKNLDLTVQRDQTVSIESINTRESALAVYPNPVVDRLAVEWATNEPAQALIYDQMGRTVYRGHFASTPAELNIGYLAKGVYILRINTSQGSLTAKIIKK